MSSKYFPYLLGFLLIPGMMAVSQEPGLSACEAEVKRLRAELAKAHKRIEEGARPRDAELRRERDDTRDEVRRLKAENMELADELWRCKSRSNPQAVIPQEPAHDIQTDLILLMAACQDSVLPMADAIKRVNGSERNRAAQLFVGLPVEWIITVEGTIESKTSPYDLVGKSEGQTVYVKVGNPSPGKLAWVGAGTRIAVYGEVADVADAVRGIEVLLVDCLVAPVTRN